MYELIFRTRNLPRTPNTKSFMPMIIPHLIHTPLQNAETPLQNAPRVSDAQGDVRAIQALLGPFSRVF